MIRKGSRSEARGGAAAKDGGGSPIRSESARSRSESILRRTHDGCMTLDASGRLTYLNESAARVLGKPAGEAIGQQAWAEFAETAGGSLEKCCRRALAEQTAVEFELSFPRDDRWFAVVAYPIADDELAICFRDITAKHRAEEKAGALRRHLETQVHDLRQLLGDSSRARDAAERAVRAKDDFLAALAHEMRTPLNPILLLATDAAKNPKLREEVRQAFGTIAKHVAQEARLIDTWMDQMRISHGNVVLDLRPLDLQIVLREAADALQAELDRRRVTLALDFTAGQHGIQGDAARLQQVFGNALQIVLSLTGEGGKIDLQTRLSPEKGMLTVAIAGGGVAISSEELERAADAFGPDPPAGSAAPRPFGGLGLALARNLVELHGGHLRAIISAGDGHAPELVVELPLAAPGEAAGSASTVPAAAHSPLGQGTDAPGLRFRILLVEDHEATRVALAQMLVRRRYLVATASSAAEAMALAARKEFDLVIADIGLPDADGYRLMASLQERHGLKGVAMTGYGLKQDIDRSKRAGFVAHLIKPISAQTLDNALSVARA